MNTLALVLAAAGLSFTSANTSLADACDPQVIQDDTSFPIRSQVRGQQGVVFMDVLIDQRGRAADVEVVDSSGYRLLDRAAQESVLTSWQFDISNCERKDLPITHRVAVEYRNDEYR